MDEEARRQIEEAVWLCAEGYVSVNYVRRLMMEQKPEQVVPLVIYTGGRRVVIGEAIIQKDGFAAANINTIEGLSILGEVDMAYSIRPPREDERLEFVPHMTFRKKYYTDQDAIAEQERAAAKPWVFGEGGEPE